MAIIFDKKIEDGFNYIVEDERGKENPFSVMIKPIDSVRLVTLEDGILKRDSNDAVSLSTGSYNVSLCCNAITGWENILDDSGKPIEMTKGPNGFISLEALAKIPTALISEISGVISAVSQDPSTIQVFTETND